jgi:hypothetical protein
MWPDGNFRITTYQETVPVYNTTHSIDYIADTTHHETLVPTYAYTQGAIEESTPTYTMTMTSEAGGNWVDMSFYEPAVVMELQAFDIGSNGTVVDPAGNHLYLLCTDGTDFKRLGQTGEGGTMPVYDGGFTNGYPFNSGRYDWRPSSHHIRDLLTSNVPTVTPMTHEECTTLDYQPGLSTTEVSGAAFHAGMDGRGYNTIDAWEPWEPDLGNGYWDAAFFRSKYEWDDRVYGGGVFHYAVPTEPPNRDVLLFPHFFGEGLCPAGASEKECAALYAMWYCTNTGSLDDTRGGTYNAHTWTGYNIPDMTAESCCKEGQTHWSDGCVEDCVLEGNKVGFLSQSSTLASVNEYIEDSLGAGWGLADYSSFFPDLPRGGCTFVQKHEDGKLINNLQDIEEHMTISTEGAPSTCGTLSRVAWPQNRRVCWGIMGCGCCRPVIETGETKETPTTTWTSAPDVAGNLTTALSWTSAGSGNPVTVPGGMTWKEPPGTPTPVPWSLVTNVTKKYKGEATTQVTKFDYGTMGTPNPIGWTETVVHGGFTLVPTDAAYMTHYLSEYTTFEGGGQSFWETMKETPIYGYSGNGIGLDDPQPRGVRFSDWCLMKNGCNYFYGDDPFGWDGPPTIDEEACVGCNDYHGGMGDTLYGPGHEGGDSSILGGGGAVKNLINSIHQAKGGGTPNLKWLEEDPEDYYGVTKSGYDTSRCCPAGEVTGWQGEECGVDGKCIKTGEQCFNLGSGEGDFIGAVEGAVYWDDISFDSNGILQGNKNEHYNFKYALIYSGDGTTEKLEGETDLGDDRVLSKMTKTSTEEETAKLQWVLEIDTNHSSPHGKGSVSCPGNTAESDGTCFDWDGDVGGGGSAGGPQGGWGPGGMSYIVGMAGPSEDDCHNCCEEEGGSSGAGSGSG